MPTPDLPQTEDEVRRRLEEICWAAAYTLGDNAPTREAVFIREYANAIKVLQQDPVTAYATASRALFPEEMTP